MAKMTCANEKLNYKNYLRVQESEFMESLCRLAHVKYHTQPINLAMKLEYLIDELFKVINFKRVPVKIETEEMSESDDDY